MSDNSNTSVLILDGETRSALAVVRSLGCAGYYCIVASDKSTSIASESKYAGATILSPPKSEGSKKYTDWLLDTISNAHFDYILPTTEFSLSSIYSNQVLTEKLLKLPFPSRDSLALALDKYVLTYLAREVEIKVPKTLLLEQQYIELKTGSFKILKKIELPLVLKARWSIEPGSKSIEKAPIFYIKTKEDLDTFLKSDSCKKFKYIAQEFIEGSGVGLFFLIKDQKLIASFSHRRILEKPPEGGVSVISESYHVPEQILKKSLQLLINMDWQGVAMVEFKYRSPDDFVLMEINPRFWGSLQLSIDSKVDFPKLLISNTEPVISGWNLFKEKIRLRWELGLLDHFIIRLRRNFSDTIFNVLLKNDLKFFCRKTNNELFRLNDPKPFFFELKEYFRVLLKR